MKSLKIIALFLLLGNSKGVSQDTLFVFVDSCIKQIKQNSKYPCVLLGPVEYPNMIFTAKTNHDPSALIEQAYYFIYKTDTTSYIEKYIKVYGEAGKNLYKSKPIQSNDAAILLFLNDNFDQIDTEHILPYIYQDSVNNTLFYDKVYQLHTYPFFCTIQFKSRIIGIKFEDIDMDEFYIPGYNLHYNLNYKFNSKTKTFEFYQKLKKIIINNFEGFKFD